MRGCLFVLVVAAALLAAVAWFGAPPIAGLLVRAALDSTGYRATTTSIAVEAAPPPRVLLGHADAVTIRSSGVEWRNLKARGLDLRLEDVDLFGRTAGTVSGSIDGAELAGTTIEPPRVAITLDGPAPQARATILADRVTVRRLVLAGVADTFHVEATDAVLVAPDRLRVSTPGAVIEGSLVIDGDHVVAMATPLGSIPLLTLDAALPLRLTGVSVVEGGLRLQGVLDVTALLR
ncbi:MAG TPA: hypothetical protein VGO64_06425 [Candidatus Limnocylindrales bacterium]|jgi:hypothetical protein|nr:hypothetical protein [Candidatus Limnocylindrales bacterium]